LIFPLLLWIVNKGAEEWRCVCLDFGLHERKLTTLMKTQFASKVTMIEHCIAYRATIIMCYSCQTKALANRIPFAQFWAIVKTICDALFPIIIVCVLNQYKSY
jgi:hypothetical protein